MVIKSSPSTNVNTMQNYLLIWTYRSGVVRCCSIGNNIETARKAKARLLNDPIVVFCRLALEINDDEVSHD